MVKDIIILSVNLVLVGCWQLEYGMSGGFPDDDWARGSHISKAKADAAWKECSSKYMKINSALVEQCMTDKGLIRLSEIKRRQKNSNPNSSDMYKSRNN